MPLKSLYLLGVCVGAAILAGIGRFALKPSLPRVALDGFFLLSVVATVIVATHLVGLALTRHARAELEDIDRSRRE